MMPTCVAPANKSIKAHQNRVNSTSGQGKNRGQRAKATDGNVQAILTPLPVANGRRVSELPTSKANRINTLKISSNENKEFFFLISQ